MSEKLKIGVVCLVRKTFDFEAAAEIYQEIIKKYGRREDVEYIFIKRTIVEPEEAKNAADELLKSNIDGVVIISGTFHLGHLALIINREIKKPLLLWGLPELPYNGGKIRLNSVCGVNLNASNLYKSGNDTFHVSVSGEMDEDWINALKIKKILSSSHIGILGYRARGFFNVGIDELGSYAETGMLLDHYDLIDVMNTETDWVSVEKAEEEIKSIFNTKPVTSDQLRKVAELSVKFENFMTSNHIDALAIRCWPEFAAQYGIAPCASMSYLQSKGFILGCEGDVEGVMSMLAHKAVGAETPFLADFSQVDLENNFALLWHCGVAPCNLTDGVCDCSLDAYHMGGKGVTADFVMKSGEISVLRIDTARGKTRMLLARGTAYPMEKELRGTYMKSRFDIPLNELLDKVVYNGIAHHISVVYGDYTKSFEILSHINKWEIIR
ncbi:MAG TPA: fucose isomerase [Thermotogota bacterium]|nr:fucose isomerase [Thermotogota bacterium]HPJ87564.1 fucose isomerase [Thermotogota bacterium]HPR94769.1 fucose isomerase [Thermotogota bacterium]